MQPKYYDAYIRIGMCELEKDDNKTAIDFFEKAISIDPECRKAYQTMTFPYVSMRQYNKALEYITKAIEKE